MTHNWRYCRDIISRISEYFSSRVLRKSCPDNLRNAREFLWIHARRTLFILYGRF